jgi:hypothetical protein
MSDCEAKALTEAIVNLTRQLRESSTDIMRDELKKGLLAIEHKLALLEIHIMAKLDDLIAAATALSTASDGVSVKLDNLIAKVDAFIAAVPSSDLSPAGEAALAALVTAKNNAAASGDKVDAEVTKLDGVLPTPAPPGPTA